MIQILKIKINIGHYSSTPFPLPKWQPSASLHQPKFVFPALFVFPSKIYFWIKENRHSGITFTCSVTICGPWLKCLYITFLWSRFPPLFRCFKYCLLFQRKIKCESITLASFDRRTGGQWPTEFQTTGRLCVILLLVPRFSSFHGHGSLWSFRMALLVRLVDVLQGVTSKAITLYFIAILKVFRILRRINPSAFGMPCCFHSIVPFFCDKIPIIKFNWRCSKTPSLRTQGRFSPNRANHFPPMLTLVPHAFGGIQFRLLTQWSIFKAPASYKFRWNPFSRPFTFAIADVRKPIKAWNRTHYFWSCPIRGPGYPLPSSIISSVV